MSYLQWNYSLEHCLQTQQPKPAVVINQEARGQRQQQEPIMILAYGSKRADDFLFFEGFLAEGLYYSLKYSTRSAQHDCTLVFKTSMIVTLRDILCSKPQS